MKPPEPPLSTEPADTCARCDWEGCWDGAVCPECGAPVKKIEEAN